MRPAQGNRVPGSGLPEGAWGRGGEQSPVSWADALIAQGEPALGRERLAVRMGWSLRGRSFQFQA